MVADCHCHCAMNVDICRKKLIGSNMVMIEAQQPCRRNQNACSRRNKIISLLTFLFITNAVCSLANWNEMIINYFPAQSIDTIWNYTYDYPFQNFSEKIKQKRAQMLGELKNKNAKRQWTVVPCPVSKKNIISAKWDKNYFKHIYEISSVITVSHSCKMLHDARPDIVPWCEITQPHVYYTWTADPELCKINSEYVDNTNCERHCENETSFRREIFPQKNHSFNSQKTSLDFFVHIMVHGVIDKIGRVTIGKKAIIPSSCHNFEIKDLMRRSCRSIFYNFIDLIRGRTTDLPFHDEVFVISQFWGYGYYHSSVECIPRLAAYLDFLKQFPKIKIHVNEQNQIYKSYFRILGFDLGRLVSGVMRAGVVYLPQGGGCGSLHQPGGLIMANLYHSFITRRMRDRQQRSYGIVKKNNATAAINYLGQSNKDRNSRINVVLVKRTGWKRRLKQHDEIAKLLNNTAKKFNLKLLIFDGDAIPPLEETMEMFYNAVMVVGPHGAGLSNVIFSLPGTIVIEVLCKFSLNMCYRDMSFSLGMRYHAIITTKNDCSEMTVEIDDMVQKINKFLKLLDTI